MVNCLDITVLPRYVLSLCIITQKLTSQSNGPWKFGPVGSQPENSEELPLGSEPLITQLRPSNQTRTPLSKYTKSTRDQNIPARAEVTDGSTVAGSRGKISLTDYATRPSAVSAFCRAVLRKLIPPQFYGSGRDKACNRDILMKHVDLFVRMRRFESLSIHEVCKGIKVRHKKEVVLRKSRANMSIVRLHACPGWNLQALGGRILHLHGSCQ